MSIRSKTRKIKLTNTPMYEPNKWNSNKYVKKSHNCYAYALNLIDSKQTKHCKQLNRTKKMILRAIVLWIILLTIIMVVVAIVYGVKINQTPSRLLLSSWKIC